MNIFNKVRYVASPHSIKRAKERINILPSFAKHNIENFCKNGEIILELDDYRYIRFKDDEYDLFFPCIKWRSAYVIKTSLTWDMVEERLQNIIDNYHSSFSSNELVASTKN